MAVDHPEAEKKCLGKKPLQPPETDPKKNPDYMGDYAEWIQCMNAKGLKVDPFPTVRVGTTKRARRHPETLIRLTRSA